MKKILLFENERCLTIKIADTFCTRLRGLLGTKRLNENEGLLIKPCNSVHMVGMRYAIDIVYLDKKNKILKVVENLKPWIGVSLCLKAENTLEMAAFSTQKYNMQVGKKLNLIEQK